MSTNDHTYRAFHLDRDGKICRVEDIEATDDTGALDQVEKLLNVYGIELWDQTRHVATVQAGRKMKITPSSR